MTNCRLDIREVEYDATIRAWLRDAWGDDAMAIRGQLVSLDETRAVLAWKADQAVGLMTLRPFEGALECVSLDVLQKGEGIGRAMVEFAIADVRAAGYDRIVAVTTNDNLPAIAFWQKVRFHLAGCRSGLATHEREGIKPSIPLLGWDGIEIRDELEFERSV